MDDIKVSDQRCHRRHASWNKGSEWFINKLLTNRNALRSYSEVLKLAEIAAVIPVSNAWPERGASSMKHVKSRLRSCLKSDLLKSDLLTLFCY